MPKGNVTLDMPVRIPSLTRYSSIGEVLNAFIDVLYRTRLDPEPVWEFPANGFCHPFLIALLALYRRGFDGHIRLDASRSSMDGYLKHVHFDDFLKLENASTAESIREAYEGKSYVPFCEINVSQGNIDPIQTIVESTIDIQTSLTRDIKESLSYMMSELMDNVREHSRSANVVLFSQFLKREKSLNLVIADMGVTIYGSYMEKGSPDMLDKIAGSEARAMELAVRGCSTKNRPGAENRGFGLSTTKEMLAAGLGGGFYLLSGGATHRHDHRGLITVDTRRFFQWKGTVAMLRIPLEAPADFNYLQYIQ